MLWILPFLFLLTFLPSNARAEGCSNCIQLDGFVYPDQVANEIFLMVGKSKKQKVKGMAVQIQKQRGGTETGTYPKFLKGGNCPVIDSEKWAIDYSHKRGFPAIHKGIDIPQPKGTPVLAVASGVVIGKFMNTNNRKGIEIVLRHLPKQTGLPFYTYTQYTHLMEMSPLPIGAIVKIGDEIGKVWNTGKMGRKIRRSALHFAVLYSKSPNWTNDGYFVAPVDSYWMDPVSFFSKSGPYESQKIKQLKPSQKAIPISYQRLDGHRVKNDAKRIWPFRCL